MRREVMSQLDTLNSKCPDADKKEVCKWNVAVPGLT
jgi:hypothetical protein